MLLDNAPSTDPRKTGPSMMYVRVCACVGQTLLSYARGFPRGPKSPKKKKKEFYLARPPCE